MYVSLGQAVLALDPGVPPNEPWFEERDAGSVHYKAAHPSKQVYLKGAMVGWKIRAGEMAGPTEIVTLTPYNESTGPRDPGDGFRWIEERVIGGRGIIMIPPPEWSPGAGTDLMRMTTGSTTLYATEDRKELADHAAPGAGGFVLYEPKAGWSSALGRWVLPALFAAAAATGAVVVSLHR